MKLLAIKHGVNYFRLLRRSKGSSVMCVIQNTYGDRVRHILQPAKAVVVFAMLITLAGCVGNKSNSGSGGSGGSGSGGSGQPGSSSLNGNWEIQLSSPSGAVPFASIAGEIATEGSLSGTTTPMIASLQLSQPSSCFAGPALVPFEGTLQTTALNLYSFAINGQYVDITATANSTGSQLTGTYSVSNGCGNGYTGNINGIKYSPLTGTYVGPIVGGPTTASLSTALTQSGNANGNGTFPVSGTVTFTGVPCFTQGTMASTAGSVIGNSVNLVFDTNETGGSQVTLTGTFDPTGVTITATTVSVSGGSCSGSLGTATIAS
jgi:hypothetical protein